MKYFIDKLINKVKKKNSHVCVGLDPHFDLLPGFLVEEMEKESVTHQEALGQAVWTFNREIIDHIADIAVAVKPQIAFYEQLGAEGIRALNKSINYAGKKGLIVILDAKRNDIGSTAEAYAAAYLDKKFIDCLTINPYLGRDGIRPFIKKENKGAFALVRTSNQSAGDLQDIVTEGGCPFYQRVGELISELGKGVTGKSGYSNLGAVIGATYPEELATLREMMPHTYFLIPGYGSQGGGADDVIAGFNDDNLGAVVNSARGIIFSYRHSSYSEREFAEAARTKALKMRDEINIRLG